MGSTTTDPLRLIGRQLLDRYRLDKCITHGGMSGVYLGRDLRLERPVCVKVFRGIDPGAEEYRTSYEHFVQEAFALSQLSHPNTLRIYDFGYLDTPERSPFQVAEYLAGGTLRDLVKRRGAIGFDEALAILEPLFGALAEAHARGIVHRDVKPSNVLLLDGDVARPIAKLADFSIAHCELRAIDPQPHRAPDDPRHGSGISLYSPGWAAPEQLAGGAVGPTADVFALGLLMAYLLAGRRLFTTNDVYELINASRDVDDYVGAALDRLALWTPLRAVLRRACRSNPAERYPTAVAFGDALRSCVEVPAADAEEVSAPPPLPPPPEIARGRRIRTLYATEQHLDVEEGRARLRLTLLGEGHLHVKGLNCFLTRTGGRLTVAVDVKGDGAVHVMSPDRELLHVVECSFSVAGRAGGVMLDFGPGRDLLLLYRQTTRQPRGHA